MFEPTTLILMALRVAPLFEDFNWWN